ncbi:hypothetical protein Tco_0729143 [Tanacetum coccineum]|uniref:Uncharacterized protein n=1 Tax=Tanacetum coccineum TaxID=301880 RepID=A0ABQ4YNZ3_9ASTR
MIAPGSSRNSQEESYGSNNMAHNYFIEEARKREQERNRNSKPSVMHTTSLQNTTNGSKPKPRSNNQDIRIIQSSSNVVSPIPIAAALRPIDPTGSPVSTLIDQDAPSAKSTSQGSTSNVQPSHTPFELLGRWIKNHPIENVIGDPSRSDSTRKQLKTDAMWSYFDAFLTSVE